MTSFCKEVCSNCLEGCKAFERLALKRKREEEVKVVKCLNFKVKELKRADFLRTYSAKQSFLLKSLAKVKSVV